MFFTDEEIAYLQSQPLARFATVGPDGQPDVVAVACEYDGTYFWIGGVGQDVLNTRKFRNIRAGNQKVAIVFDDLLSIEPFNAREMRIYGVADGPFDRVGMVGPGHYLRITPTTSWSWNLAGEPAKGAWYDVRRTVHSVS